MPVNAPLGFHVITYVERASTHETDVVAHGAIKPPAAAGAEGEATKGVLGKTENHQCDGSDGCNQLHAYAEERVVARATGDGVGVVWRRFHPLVARGEATPGHPFEAEDGGVRVRVETRAIVGDAGDVFTDQTISQAAIKRLEGELTAKEKVAELRVSCDHEYQKFCSEALQPARARLAEATEALKRLPGRKDEVAKVLKDATAKLDAVGKDSLAELQQLAHEPNDQTPAAVQGFGAKYAPQIAKAFEGIAKIEASAKELIEVQGQIEKVLADVKALMTRAEAAAMALPGLKLDGAGHDALDVQVKALAGASRKDNADLADLKAQLKAAQTALPKVTAELEKRIEAVQVEADAFEARKVDVAKWAPGGAGAQELDEYIEAAGGFEGFAVEHWKAQAKVAVAALNVSAAAVEKLKFGREKDDTALKALEAGLAPLAEFTAKLDAEMAKRGSNVYAEVKQNRLAFQAPSAWLKVKNLAADGTCTLDVNLRNNDKRPLLIGLRAGNELVQQVVLPTDGSRATFEVAGRAPPFTVVVMGLGAAPRGKQTVEVGEQVELKQLEIVSAAIENLQANATRHVHPYFFTPRPDAPQGAMVARVEVPPNGRLSQQRAPGRPAGD